MNHTESEELCSSAMSAVWVEATLRLSRDNYRFDKNGEKVVEVQQGIDSESLGGQFKRDPLPAEKRHQDLGRLRESKEKLGGNGSGRSVSRSVSEVERHEPNSWDYIMWLTFEYYNNARNPNLAQHIGNPEKSAVPASTGVSLSSYSSSSSSSSSPPPSSSQPSLSYLNFGSIANTKASVPTSRESERWVAPILPVAEKQPKHEKPNERSDDDVQVLEWEQVREEGKEKEEKEEEEGTQSGTSGGIIGGRDCGESNAEDDNDGDEKIIAKEDKKDSGGSSDNFHAPMSPRSCELVMARTMAVANAAAKQYSSHFSPLSSMYDQTPMSKKMSFSMMSMNGLDHHYQQPVSGDASSIRIHPVRRPDGVASEILGVSSNGMSSAECGTSTGADRGGQDSYRPCMLTMPSIPGMAVYNHHNQQQHASAGVPYAYELSSGPRSMGQVDVGFPMGIDGGRIATERVDGSNPASDGCDESGSGRRGRSSNGRKEKRQYKTNRLESYGTDGHLNSFDASGEAALYFGDSGAAGVSPGWKKQRKLMKKNPDAPKRFLSSFMHFRNEKQIEIRKQLEKEASLLDPSAKVQQAHVVKVISELWGALSLEEKVKYESVSHQDKMRYQKELEAFEGPLQVPNKRKRKDPSAPKRNMSAFLIFKIEKGKEIKTENPQLPSKDVARLMGKLWRDMKDEEREPYKQLEREQRRTYLDQMAVFQKQRGEVSTSAAQATPGASGDQIEEGYKEMIGPDAVMPGISEDVDENEMRESKIAPRQEVEQGVSLDMSPDAASSGRDRSGTERAETESSPMLTSLRVVAQDASTPILGKRDLELANQSGAGMALVIDTFAVRETDEAQNENSDTCSSGEKGSLHRSQYVEDYKAIYVDDDSVFSSNDEQVGGDS